MPRRVSTEASSASCSPGRAEDLAREKSAARFPMPHCEISTLSMDANRAPSASQVVSAAFLHPASTSCATKTVLTFGRALRELQRRPSCFSEASSSARRPHRPLPPSGGRRSCGRPTVRRMALEVRGQPCRSDHTGKSCLEQCDRTREQRGSKSGSLLDLPRRTLPACSSHLHASRSAC